jgi:hypothetical protein
MIKKNGRVLSTGLMEENTKVVGRTANSMVKEPSSNPMGKKNGKWEDGERVMWIDALS